MALAATTRWRIRPGGNAANGGSYDPSVSGVLATTLTAGISAGATSISVASATGWPGSGNFYAGLNKGVAEGVAGGAEIVLVTGGQGTLNWTVTRAQLGTTALAFSSGDAVDNDLSRCDSPATSGTVGTGTGTTTFSDVAAAFDLTSVGNGIRIASGTGATVGYYIIQSFTNATTVVLDRVFGTTSLASWRMGGAQAEPWSTVANNGGATGNKAVAGNSVYVRGAGSTNPSSADYTKGGGGFTTPPSGDSTSGYIKMIGEYGRPRLTTDGLMWYQGSLFWHESMYYTCSGASNGSVGLIGEATNPVIKGCCINTNGQAVIGAAFTGGAILACEVWSGSTSPTLSAGICGVKVGNYGAVVGNNYIHHNRGGGVIALGASGAQIEGNLIFGNKEQGVFFDSGAVTVGAFVGSNTIDSNGGDGIQLNHATQLQQSRITNNIISNQNQASKYGINANFGSTAVNDRIKLMTDYNDLYNNTTNYNNLSGGAHDQTLDPQYTNTATYDYSIGTNLKALGYGLAPLP